MAVLLMKYICPVCGYPYLQSPPYDSDGNPSYDICDCCGFEFGFDDANNGVSFKDYREKWIANGNKWFWPDKKPSNWSLKKQIKAIIDDL